MLQLTIKYEDGDSSVHPIDQPVMRIGRRTDNDIVIPDSYVSGYHAEFQRLDNGDYEVVDQDSHNGTTVNGKKAKRTKVKPNDVIIFGILEAVVGEGDPTPKVTPLRPPRSAASMRRPTANPLAKTLPHTLSESRRIPEPAEPDPAVSDLQDKVKAAQAEIAKLRAQAVGGAKPPGAEPDSKAAAPAEVTAIAAAGAGVAAKEMTWRDRLAQRGLEKREKKIEALESYLGEKTAQLKLVRQQLAELSKAAKKQDGLRREIEALQLEHEELQRRNSQMREFEAQMAKREKDLVSIEEKLAAHAETKSKHDREIAQRKKELEQLNLEFKDFDRDRKTEEERLEQVRSEIESSANINADLAEENEQLLAEVEKRRLRLEKDRDEVQATERELTVLRDDVSSTRKTLRTLRGRESRLSSTSPEGQKVETKINDLWDELAVIQDEIELARKERDLAYAQRQEMADELAEFKENQSELRQARDRLTTEVGELEAKRAEAEKKTDEAKKKADDYRNSYAGLREEREKLTADRESLRETILKLEAERQDGRWPPPRRKTTWPTPRDFSNGITPSLCSCAAIFTARKSGFRN